MKRKPLLITINGPLSSGKTWCVNQFMTGKASHLILKTNKTIVNFQHPLKKAAMALLAVPEDTDYGVFKNTMYQGATGREWMIRLSEDFAKNYNPSFFVESLLARIDQLQNSHVGNLPLIVFSDSNGFPLELDSIRASPKVNLIACCIEPTGSAPRGELWSSKDSRFNLAHMCELIAKDSDELLGKIEKALRRRDAI